MSIPRKNLHLVDPSSAPNRTLWVSPDRVFEAILKQPTLTARKSMRQAMTDPSLQVWIEGMAAYVSIHDSEHGMELATPEVIKYFAAHANTGGTVELVGKLFTRSDILQSVGGTNAVRVRVNPAMWSSHPIVTGVSLGTVIERVRSTAPGRRRESAVLCTAVYQLLAEELVGTDGTPMDPRGIACPLSSFASTLGVGQASLASAVDRLGRAGAITSTHERGQPTRYHLTDINASAEHARSLALRPESDEGTGNGRGTSTSRATSESVAESIERAFALMQAGMISATEYAEWKAKELARI